MDGICDDCIDNIYDHCRIIQRKQEELDWLDWDEDKMTEEEFWKLQDQKEKELEELIKHIASSMGADMPDHNCIKSEYPNEECCCSCHK